MGFTSTTADERSLSYCHGYIVRGVYSADILWDTAKSPCMIMKSLVTAAAASKESIYQIGRVPFLHSDHTITVHQFKRDWLSKPMNEIHFRSAHCTTLWTCLLSAKIGVLAHMARSNDGAGRI